MFKNKKLGFTLAETLITIIIVGIIAAITIPSLIVKYQKEKTSVQVKKAYSEVTQAIKLSQIDNGNMNNWNWSIVQNVNKENNKIFCDKYFFKYLRANYCNQDTNIMCKYGGISTSKDTRYLLDNGTMIVFSPNFSDKSIGLMFVPFKQSDNDKAILGKHRFYFTIKNDKVLPFGYKVGHTRAELLGNGVQDKNYIYSCRKSRDENNSNDLNRHGCTWLLYLDGWTFKDDYPW